MTDSELKVRVINLTQGGLKAMEELAKLEAQRGNPEYLEGEIAEDGFRERDFVRHKLTGMHGNGDLGKNGSRRASNEMCIFLILNISSLQLIPVNMIAYRSQYGSANPTAIITPAIAATLISTLVAIVYCKMKDGMSKGHASADLTTCESHGAFGRGAGSRQMNLNGQIPGKASFTYSGKKQFMHTDSGRNNRMSAKTGDKGEKAV